MQHDAPSDQRVAVVHPALWALRSKHPGQSMSYEIVVGVGDQHFAEQLIRSGIVGNPERIAPGRPDEMPWLAFVGGESSPVMACVSTGWTDEVDGTGQPIAPVKLVYLPWQDTATYPSTWQTLAGAVNGLPWAGVDQPPAVLLKDGRVGLDLAGDPERILTAAVERCGFAWAASVAALLLDGAKVAVLAPMEKFPHPTERLVALDAVFALLPYWCRATFSAATWTSPRARHTIRLGFSARPGDGQIGVQWGVTPPRELLQSRHAQEYLDELLTVSQMPDLGPGRVVRHLLGRRQLEGGDRAARAVADLREIRLAELAQREVHEQRGRPDRVGQVLADGWDRLDTGKQRDFTCFLFDRAGVPDTMGAQAAGVIARYWATGMTDVLLARAEHSLSASGVGAVRHQLSEVHRLAPPDAGAAERIFQRLASNAKTPAASILQLIIDPPTGLQTDRPQVAQVLLYRPDLFSLYLRHTLSTRVSDSDGTRLIGDLTWLEQAVQGRPPAWFRPIVAIAREDTARAVPEELEALLQVWPDAGEALLQVAELRQVTDRMFGFMWPALVRLVTLRQANGGLTQPLPAFKPQALTDYAKADLLNLLAQGTTPALSAYPTAPPALYCEGLAVAWSHPCLEAHRARLAPLLVDNIGGKPGDQRVTKLWTIGDAARDQQVTEAVTASLANEVADARPMFLDLPPEWARRVADGGQQRQFWPLHQLAALTRSSGTGLDEVVRAVWNTVREGASQEEFVPLLGTWLSARLDSGAPGSVVRDTVSAIAGDHPMTPLSFDVGRAILSGLAGPVPMNALVKTMQDDEFHARTFAQLRNLLQAPAQPSAPERPLPRSANDRGPGEDRRPLPAVTTVPPESTPSRSGRVLDAVTKRLTPWMKS